MIFNLEDFVVAWDNEHNTLFFQILRKLLLGEALALPVFYAPI